MNHKELLVWLELRTSRLNWCISLTEKETGFDGILAAYHNALLAEISDLENAAKLAYAEENDWRNPK